MFGTLRFGYATFFAIVAMQFLASLTLGRQPLSSYIFGFTGWRVLIWTFPLLLWLGWLSITTVIRRIDRPTLVIWRVVRRNRNWLFRAALFASLIVPFSRSFAAIKVAIPRLNPFYADPFLIKLDRAIFFGTDPWRISHAYMGATGTHVIDRIYIMWFFQVMALVAWILFTRDQKFQLRGFLTVNLSWIILGNMLALAMSSVGPCYYEIFYNQKYFIPLMDTLNQYHDFRSRSLEAQGYLLKYRGSENWGAGISAMPSLHVAMAFLTWLCVRKQTVRKLLHHLVFTYFLLILIGSVHLGWHYASDGIVSIIGVALIWWGSGRFVDWVEAREARLLCAEQDRAGVIGPAPAFATPE